MFKCWRLALAKCLMGWVGSLACWPMAITSSCGVKSLLWKEPEHLRFSKKHCIFVWTGNVWLRALCIKSPTVTSGRLALLTFHMLLEADDIQELWPEGLWCLSRPNCRLMEPGSCRDENGGCQVFEWQECGIQRDCSFCYCRSKNLEEVWGTHKDDRLLVCFHIVPPIRTRCRGFSAGEEDR